MVRTLAVCLILNCGAGCHRPAPPPPRPSHAAVERGVRAAVADFFQLEPDGVDFARPLFEEPTGADNLDLSDLLALLERRFDVSIPEDVIETRLGGHTVEDNPRLTPAALVQLVEDALTRRDARKGGR